MSYTITPSSDGTYIFMKVVGDINRVSAMTQNIEAHALGKKLGINKYLVDLTESRNTDSIIGNYEFMYKDMTTPSIDPSARIAALVAPGDNSHDFAVTVAANAGFSMALFTDLTNALNYLKEP
jgi:hypothetical protein